MPQVDVNNLLVPVLPSAVRSADTVPDQANNPVNNPVNTGAYFILRVTATSGTGGLRLRVLTCDCTGTSELNTPPDEVTTTGTFVYLFKAGALGGAAKLEQVCAVPLPEKFVPKVEHLDGSDYEYSLDMVLLV